MAVYGWSRNHIKTIGTETDAFLITSWNTISYETSFLITTKGIYQY
jgi:hypothetical protein